MTTSFRFDPAELPPEARELRQEVRAFLAAEAEAGTLFACIAARAGFRASSAASSGPGAGSA